MSTPSLNTDRPDTNALFAQLAENMRMSLPEFWGEVGKHFVNYPASELSTFLIHLSDSLEEHHPTQFDPKIRLAAIQLEVLEGTRLAYEKSPPVAPAEAELRAECERLRSELRDLRELRSRDGADYQQILSEVQSLRRMSRHFNLEGKDYRLDRLGHPREFRWKLTVFGGATEPNVVRELVPAVTHETGTAAPTIAELSSQITAKDAEIAELLEAAQGRTKLLMENDTTIGSLRTNIENLRQDMKKLTDTIGRQSNTIAEFQNRELDRPIPNIKIVADRDEVVNHPRHYNVHPSGVECIDIIEHFPANIALAMKHLWRCDEKHDTPFEDLDKAVWYVQRQVIKLRRDAERAAERA